jgi:hypothetical protein
MKKFFLVLFITIMIGIQPVCAQSESDEVVQPVAPKKIVMTTEIVINLSLVSDDEFFDALELADDVEMVNEETAMTEESDIDPIQG